MNLTIGQLPPELEQGVIAALKRLGVREQGTWWRAGQAIATLSALNASSVCQFTDHAARLDGFDDSTQAIGRTRFKNLPWWMISVWLPIPFPPPPEPIISDSGFPVFLGSCHGLLEELAELKQLSGSSLGDTPQGYGQMRADYRAFCRCGFELNDDRAVVQWVWLVLHDAAGLAVAHSAPLLGGE